MGCECGGLSRMRMRKKGTTIHSKGYPRVTCGPLRHQYVHRVVAAALVGRPLTKDEEVHHTDSDKKNFWFTNLYVLGTKDHSWVSSKQAWFMRNNDAIAKQRWDEFMREKHAQQVEEISLAKQAGVPWRGQPDGTLEAAFMQCSTVRQ